MAPCSRGRDALSKSAGGTFVAKASRPAFAERPRPEGIVKAGDRLKRSPWLLAFYKDIILIYENFEKKIKNKYIDETDLLSILEKNIDKINLLKNSEIYIDEFAGFTEQEYLIIKKLIKLSEKITVTFCIDNLDFNTNPNIDIFYQNKKTLKKIINLNEENKKIEYINLEKINRFKNEELIYLEKYLYNKKIKKYEKEIKNINLFLAKNEYSEIENAAKKINELMQMILSTLLLNVAWIRRNL